MPTPSLLLELVLVALLAATLFHALRLERALGVLKRDRAELQALVDGFNGATRHAEAGIDRLRGAVDSAGRSIAVQVQEAAVVRQDLQFLIERGEKLADRLEGLVRGARTLAEPRPAPREPEAEMPPRVRSQAERDLLRALGREG